MRLPKSPAAKRFLGLFPSIFTIAFFMLIPMGILLVFSFLESDPYGGVEWVFSIDSYIQILFDRQSHDQ
ncbi:MAG: ABC transporter permease, partial [Pseudomonadota bacterium]